VFEVARGTGRGEGLVGVMDRRVMATETGVVTDLLEERSGTGYVTQAALLSEDRVRR